MQLRDPLEVIGFSDNDYETANELNKKQINKGPSEFALNDLPHPFLKRVAEIVHDRDNLGDHEIELIKTTLATFAYLQWPGDMQKFMYADKAVQMRVQDAVTYLCTPIPKGSPIAPSHLRQGVIPTAPRA